MAFSGPSSICKRRSYIPSPANLQVFSVSPSDVRSIPVARNGWPSAKPCSPRFDLWERIGERSHAIFTRSIPMTAPLLEVRDLKVYFPVFHGFVQRLIGGGDAKVHAVDGVTFSIPEGQVFGLVGVSGCGITTIAKTLVGLVTPNSGQIVFRGKDVTHPDRKGLFHLREHIQRIYQDPHAALSPAMTVGEAVADVLRTHGLPSEGGGRNPPKSDDDLRAAGYRVFDDVGLRPPAFLHDKYPGALSER